MEERDDVPSSAFIHGDDDEMVEHGIFPSTTAEVEDVVMVQQKLGSKMEIGCVQIQEVAGVAALKNLMKKNWKKYGGAGKKLRRFH
uniref:Uncharacterized protein n=1 Tax=Aegilops tauschii TaxID=37682 RepID=N1R2Q8_AEGTA